MMRAFAIVPIPRFNKPSRAVEPVRHVKPRLLDRIPHFMIRLAPDQDLRARVSDAVGDRRGADPPSLAGREPGHSPDLKLGCSEKLELDWGRGLAEEIRGPELSGDGLSAQELGQEVEDHWPLSPDDLSRGRTALGTSDECSAGYQRLPDLGVVPNHRSELLEQIETETRHLSDLQRGFAPVAGAADAGDRESGTPGQ